MITVDSSDVSRVIGRLGHVREKIPVAIANAVNRAADAGKTEATRRAVGKFYIKSTEVRSTINVTKARKGLLMAYVRSRSTRRELIMFNVSPRKPQGRPSGPLKVAIVRGGGIKRLSNAFVKAGKSSGKLHVLQRAGKERYPLHIKYGLTVPQMLESQWVRQYVEEKAKEVLPRRLEHEVQRILKGLGGK